MTGWQRCVVVAAIAGCRPGAPAPAPTTAEPTSTRTRTRTSTSTSTTEPTPAPTPARAPEDEVQVQRVLEHLARTDEEAQRREPLAETPEVVFDLADEAPSGAPPYLLDPIDRRRGGLRGCGRTLEMPETIRATIYLDDRGAVSELVGLDSSDLRVCIGRVLRTLRFEIPARVELTELYVRFEYGR